MSFEDHHARNTGSSNEADEKALTRAVFGLLQGTQTGRAYSWVSTLCVVGTVWD